MESTKPNKTNAANKLLKLLILSTPVLFGLFIIIRYGLNVPFGDERDNIEFINSVLERGLRFNDLFIQHNEHRIFFPRLIFLVVGVLTHYNVKVLLYVSWVFTAATYFVYLRYLKQSASSSQGLESTGQRWERTLIGVAIGFCVFHVIQEENILWGFQVAWYMLLFFLVSSFYCFHRWVITRKCVYFVFAILLGITSVFSSMHGLFVFPVILGVMLLLWLSKTNIPIKFPLLILIMAVFSFAAYLYNYSKPEHHPEYFSASFMQMTEYYLYVLGSPFRTWVWKGSAIAYFGLLVFLGNIIITLWLLINKKIINHVFPMCLIWFAFVFCLSLTMGRVGFGVGQALAPRYTTFSLLAIIGLSQMVYVEFIAGKRWGRKKLIAWLALGLPLAFLTLQNTRTKRCSANLQNRKNIQAILINYKNASTGTIEREARMSYGHVKILEQRRWSVFHKHQATNKLTYEIYAPIPISQSEVFSAADLKWSKTVDDNLLLQCGTYDPQLIIPLDKPIIAPDVPQSVLSITFQNNIDGRLQIFYDYGSGFSEAESTQRRCLPISGKTVTFQVPVIGWGPGAYLKRVRIDPPDASTFIIEKIQIEVLCSTLK